MSLAAKVRLYDVFLCGMGQLILDDPTGSSLVDSSQKVMWLLISQMTSLRPLPIQVNCMTSFGRPRLCPL